MVYILGKAYGDSHHNSNNNSHGRCRVIAQVHEHGDHSKEREYQTETSRLEFSLCDLDMIQQRVSIHMTMRHSDYYVLVTFES